MFFCYITGGVGASATAVLGHVDDFPENPLALWGQFSCQLHVRPVCFLKPDLDGHLLLQVCTILYILVTRTRTTIYISLLLYYNDDNPVVH